MIHLDGLLDIGKKWNYELQLTQVTEGKIKFALESKLSPPPLTTKSEIEYILPNMIRIGNVGKGVKTKTFIPSKEEGMKINISLQFENDEIGPVKKKKNNKSHLRQRAEILTPRKIKDDESIQRYILHLYNQALIVLENIQVRFENKIDKHKFHRIKQLYKEKLEEHVTKLGNQTLRTKLSTQKAILNTLSVSNRIITKIFDHMNMFIKGSLRNSNSTIVSMQKELEKELNSEFVHLCKQYEICRTSRTFSDLLTDMLTMILKTDNRKVKQASDALTEVLKDAVFLRIMDWQSHKQFKVLIRNLEYKNEEETRIVFLILRNVIANRNKPIKIYGAENMKLVNKTVVLQAILNEFDKVILGDQNNTKQWNDLLQKLEEWTKASEYRNIISKIWSELIKIMEVGAEKMTEEVVKTVRENIRFVLDGFENK